MTTATATYMALFAGEKAITDAVAASSMGMATKTVKAAQATSDALFHAALSFQVLAVNADQVKVDIAAEMATFWLQKAQDAAVAATLANTQDEALQAALIAGHAAAVAAADGSSLAGA